MNSQATITNSEAAIMARLIQLQQDNLSRGAAEYLLSLKFEEDDIDRMNTLAQLAQSGNFSQDEAAELDSYIHVSNLLAVMQSKARHSLGTENQIRG